MKRNKWKLFKSLQYRVDSLRQAPPPEVEVPMGRPTQGLVGMPIEIIDDDIGAAMEVTMVRKKKLKVSISSF